MYYYEQTPKGVREMRQVFAERRKTRKPRTDTAYGVKEPSDIGKGWPHYRDLIKATQGTA